MFYDMFDDNMQLENYFNPSFYVEILNKDILSAIDNLVAFAVNHKNSSEELLSNEDYLKKVDTVVVLVKLLNICNDYADDNVIEVFKKYFNKRYKVSSKEIDEDLRQIFKKNQ